MKKYSFFIVVAGLCIVILLLTGSAMPTRAAEDAPANNSDSANKSADDKSGNDKTDSKKKGNDDVIGGRFAGDPIYVHIAPLVLPVINDSGVEQLVTIMMDVQVKDFDAADAIHANMPRVMDALMRNLYGGLGQGTLRNGKLANVVKIKDKAIAAVSEVIGAENVRDVLVQGVAQRML